MREIITKGNEFKDNKIINKCTTGNDTGETWSVISL